MSIVPDAQMCMTEILFCKKKTKKKKQQIQVNLRFSCRAITYFGEKNKTKVKQRHSVDCVTSPLMYVGKWQHAALIYKVEPRCPMWTAALAQMGRRLPMAPLREANIALSSRCPEAVADGTGKGGRGGMLHQLLWDRRHDVPFAQQHTSPPFFLRRL